jgi:hypothetical protein
MRLIIGDNKRKKRDDYATGPQSHRHCTTRHGEGIACSLNTPGFGRSYVEQDEVDSPVELLLVAHVYALQI